MIVRKARARDLKSLTQLSQDCLAEENKTVDWIQYPVMADWDHALKFVLGAENPDSLILVAEDKGRVVGFIVASVQHRVVASPRRYVMIETMFVIPEYRTDISVAEELVNQVRGWVEYKGGISFVELPVRPGEANIARWIRKRWTPYMLMMFKPLEDK